MASPIRVAILAWALALALASAPASHAGFAITQVVQDLYGDERLDTNVIRIEKGKIRVDLGGDPDTYQIYRGDLAVLWTVNLKEKTYVQRTGEEVEAMRAKMNEAIRKIRERKESFAPGTTYRKAGDGGKVGGWPTEKYAGFRRGGKVVEAWVTDAGNLGMGEPEARALRDMAGYFDKYSSGPPGGSADKGVTVRTINFRDGKPMWRTEYAAVREETCAAQLFDIPPGLRVIAGE